MKNLVSEVPVRTVFGSLRGLPYLLRKDDKAGIIFNFWKNHFFILYCGAA